MYHVAVFLLIPEEPARSNLWRGMAHHMIHVVTVASDVLHGRRKCAPSRP
jgi:hypothetical protein